MCDVFAVKRRTSDDDQLNLDGKVVVNPDVELDEHVAILATNSGEDYFIDLNSDDYPPIENIIHSLVIKIDRQGKIGEIRFSLDLTKDPQDVADRLITIVANNCDQLLPYFSGLDEADEAIPRLNELIHRLCLRIATSESLDYISEQMAKGDDHPRLEHLLKPVCQASDALMALN